MKWKKSKKKIYYVDCNSWTSKYASVNKLWFYLKNEKTASISSRENFCNSLNLFCRFVRKNPDELIQMKKETLEKEVEKILSRYACRRTANLHMYNLKTFFKKNGRNNLEFPHFYEPSRGGRTKPEYIPRLEEAWKMAECAGSLKARAIIIFLFTTGLRNSTLRAILFGGTSTKYLIFQNHTLLEELKKGMENLFILVYEEMKESVPRACKGRIPYYVFTPKETTEAILDYLNEREKKYEPITEDQFLFPSDSRKLTLYERLRTPMSTEALIKLVKTAAYRAGIKQWKYVSPQSLRTTLKNILRNQPEGSRLDKEDQEFFFGHIMPGSMEAYYDYTKIEEMRKKFSKLKFKPNIPHDGEQFTRKFAKLYGIDYELVVQEAEKRSDREPNEDEIMTVLKKFIENGKKKERKIIDESELTKYLDDGWDPEHILPSGKIVVCKSSI